MILQEEKKDTTDNASRYNTLQRFVIENKVTSDILCIYSQNENSDKVNNDTNIEENEYSSSGSVDLQKKSEGDEEKIKVYQKSDIHTIISVKTESFKNTRENGKFINSSSNMSTKLCQSDSIDDHTSAITEEIIPESIQSLNPLFLLSENSPISINCLANTQKNDDLCLPSKILVSSPTSFLLKSQVFILESRIRLPPTEITCPKKSRPIEDPQIRNFKILKVYFRLPDQKPIIDIELLEATVVPSHYSSIIHDLSIQEVNSEDEPQFLQESSEPGIFQDNGSTYSGEFLSNIQSSDSCSDLETVLTNWVTYQPLFKPLLPLDNYFIEKPLLLINSMVEHLKISALDPSEMFSDLCEYSSESEDNVSASHSNWIIV